MGSRAGRAAIAAMVVALSACKDYDSAFPLGPASEGVIEPRLLGSWTCVGTEEDARPGVLVFTQFDETQYYVRSEGEGEQPSHLRAYSSLVGERPFFNLQELRDGGIDAERGWVFMQYELAEDGGLRLHLVAPDVFEGHDDSTESVRQALEAQLGDPEALIDGLTCTRMPARQ
jgi:hypothetical protein